MRTFFIFCMTQMLLFGAQMVDGISFVVNKEPVTLYELHSLANSSDMDIDRAMRVLIQEKLHQQEMERLGIEVERGETMQRANMIAANNGMELSRFRQSMQESGRDWERFLERLKKQIKREKLYDAIAQNRLGAVSKQELEDFYTAHREDYSYPLEVKVRKFFSPDKASLQEKMLAPLASIQDVLEEEERVKLEELPGSLANMLATTKEGEYTTIIPLQEGFVSFYVEERLALREPDFKDVENAVYERYLDEREAEVAKEHFNKLEANADIKVLRLK